MHLFLSSLPRKIQKAISTLGYEVDQQKGMELLRKCSHAKQHIYAPIASVM